MMRKVAVFDFDGTLTQKDTLLEFIRFSCGAGRFLWGFMLFSPILILMKLHLYPNWKAKEKVFAYFFKGWAYARFKAKGEEFADVIEMIKKEEVLSLMNRHLQDGDEVYVISASIEEWVRPWCLRQGVHHVVGTKMEVDGKGIITGRFLSKNCYGQEKVNRLLAYEPIRGDYELYAYGDSRGDREMLEFADYAVKL